VIHAREGTDALPFDRSVLPDKSVLPISPADLAIYFLISAKRVRGAPSLGWRVLRHFSGEK